MNCDLAVGIFIFCQFFCQIAARACLGSCNRWRNQRNLYIPFANSFNEKNILEQTDIPAITHLGLPSLCINSSENSDNRYEIDKLDVKPAEAHVVCTRPNYSPRTLVIQ